MKNNKRYIAILAAVFVLCFAGCLVEDELPEASFITISGIPAKIEVNDSDPKEYNDTFKVYINISDYMDETEEPKAKGSIKVTEDMKQADGTYTVTIPLMDRNPYFGEPHYDPNPNIPTGPWSGTAHFFSVMISPQKTVPGEINAIWAKGGYDLNETKQNIDWEKSSLQDFRNKYLVTTLNLGPKVAALYNDIICSDPEITSSNP